MEFRPNRFQELPTVVKNLVIINSLVVLAQYVIGRSGFDLSTLFGLHYFKSHYFHWWQILTHMFMHGSYNDVNLTLLHLVSNMFALWMFGRILENLWGPKKFLTFYLICGLGAALCHMAVLGFQYGGFDHAFEVYQQSPTLDHYMLFIKQHNLENIMMIDNNGNHIYSFNMLKDMWSNNPSSTLFSNQSISLIHGFQMQSYDEATVGASGAVFGVLFAFGYLFPNMELLFYFLFPIKAKYFVGLYAIFELYAGVKNSAGDNVAHFAHLGGMLFAFILLRFWKMQSHNRWH